uniref:sphingolipid 4-desaturase n=1 Tax=Panagrellus redivivus TaxID=6233 RepID=A0A7E4V1J0_PANRE
MSADCPRPPSASICRLLLRPTDKFFEKSCFCATSAPISVQPIPEHDDDRVRAKLAMSCKKEVVVDIEPLLHQCCNNSHFTEPNNFKSTPHLIAMGQKVSREDFHWVYTEQPHSDRRKAIVAAHPEIKQLFGVDPSLKYVVSCSVILQILVAYLLSESSWVLIFLQIYFFGGVVNHALTLAIHDISHNTAFGNDQPLANRFFGMWANLPLSVPMSVSFKKYHVEHHRYLGEDALDVDIPSEFEVKFFCTPLKKMLWLFLQPLFYALRPMFIYNKAPTDMEIINITIQMSFNFAVYYFWGVKSIVYLFLCTFIALGFHPSAGHFIAEHYVFFEGQETYSYYGPWNYVLYNVGYHMEHHDFPYIPGCNLPQVAKIAPEFYDDLRTHESWLNVIYEFIFNPTLGLTSRIKRPASVPQEVYGNNMLANYVKPLVQRSRQLLETLYILKKKSL